MSLRHKRAGVSNIRICSSLVEWRVENIEVVEQVMFETDCRTVYQDWSKAKRTKRKTLPQTVCKRVPKTLCGGSNCE